MSEPWEPAVPDEPYTETREPVCECGHVLDEHDPACHVPGCGCVHFDEAQR